MRRRPPERVPAKTFSYYGGAEKSEVKRPDLSSGRAHVGHRLRLVPSVIALIVIVFSFLFSLTLSARPAVSTLDNQPSVYRPVEDYAAAAEEQLSGSLGNRTKLTVDSQAVETSLMDQFPELAAVALRLPVLGRRPNLILDIKPPSLLLIASTKVYVLDGSGTVVGEAASLPEEVKQGLAILRDDSGLEVEIGKQVVTSDTISFIDQVLAQLAAKDLTVSELSLPASASELDIRVEGLGYFIKTDPAGNARQQVGSFLAVKEQGVKPREYMDVRVEEKVFYK